MFLSDKILGSTAAKHIRATAGGAVLVIGKDTFTRAHLASTGCFHFAAAARLTNAVSELRPRVDDLKDLYRRFPPLALCRHGIGPISFAVLGAAFELKRIGGTRPLEEWTLAHAPADAKRPLLTINSMKHHAQDEDR